MAARVAMWVAMATVGSALVAPVAPASAAPCLYPPVVGRIVDPFRAPACEWCPGNRGIDYRVASAATVRAAGSGTVTFVGSVAGTSYLVIELSNGWRLTHGDLAGTRLRIGEQVVAGAVVGRASGHFYLGLRIGNEYRDPAPFIGRRAGRARLVPLDGTPAHVVDPAGATAWSCRAPAGVVGGGYGR